MRNPIVVPGQPSIRVDGKQLVLVDMKESMQAGVELGALPGVSESVGWSEERVCQARNGRCVCICLLLVTMAVFVLFVGGECKEGEEGYDEREEA